MLEPVHILSIYVLHLQKAFHHLQGENLRLASTESEVNVTIGTRLCNITSLAMNQLVCLPPEVQPSGTDEVGRWTDNGLPMVVVSFFCS